ncbi:hypothetical protein N9059_01250, partial [bacterium]|nr:hypothetical protein [bacterium]
MNESEPTERDQDEISILSLLLGELSPTEAAVIRKKLESDSSLAAYADDLQNTLGLVREATGPAVDSDAVLTPTTNTDFQLDSKQRKELLKAFKTPPTRKAKEKQKKDSGNIIKNLSWFLPLSAAACLMLALLINTFDINIRSTKYGLMDVASPAAEYGDIFSLYDPTSSEKTDWKESGIEANSEESPPSERISAPDSNFYRLEEKTSWDAAINQENQNNALIADFSAGNSELGFKPEKIRPAAETEGFSRLESLREIKKEVQDMEGLLTDAVPSPEKPGMVTRSRANIEFSIADNDEDIDSSNLERGNLKHRFAGRGSNASGVTTSSLDELSLGSGIADSSSPNSGASRSSLRGGMGGGGGGGGQQYGVIDGTINLGREFELVDAFGFKPSNGRPIDTDGGAPMLLDAFGLPLPSHQETLQRSSGSNLQGEMKTDASAWYVNKQLESGIDAQILSYFDADGGAAIEPMPPAPPATRRVVNGLASIEASIPEQTESSIIISGGFVETAPKPTSMISGGSSAILKTEPSNRSFPSSLSTFSAVEESEKKKNIGNQEKNTNASWRARVVAAEDRLLRVQDQNQVALVETVIDEGLISPAEDNERTSGSIRTVELQKLSRLGTLAKGKQPASQAGKEWDFKKVIPKPALRSLSRTYGEKLQQV